ncbi:MAG: DUF3307 domain-containing protein [Longicatena sp.]
MSTILILFICHIISDFYIQSNIIAKNKKNLNTSMLKHSFIYSVTYLLALCLVKEEAYYLIVIIISHLLIDVCSVHFKNKYQDKECMLFCIDQILHLTVIYYCSFYIVLKETFSLNILTTILAILILIKPVSIFISLIFKTIFRNEKNVEEIKIGRYIGYLERTIIFLLCIFNSISTIGFVLAAKTLVRYKDINTNENHFQEKYLIGTLLSTIGALCCFALVKFIGIN